jgi:hypothetical protein
MTKSEQLRDFVLQYLNQFAGDSGGYPAYELPDFELYAQDYLDFAEQELNAYENAETERDKTRHLINCISHLKRALDCQLDTFLNIFGLDKYFAKKNLKIGKKLDFLKAVGVFSSRSLVRFNIIRNRIEHQFESPKIDDIEAYYDLVLALVALLQRPLCNEIYLLIYDENGAERIGDFSIRYDLEELSVLAEWKINGLTEQVGCTVDEYTDFAYFLRVLFLLHLHESQQPLFISNHYVAVKIADNTR